jgi:hypothetical protein
MRKINSKNNWWFCEKCDYFINKGKDPNAKYCAIDGSPLLGSCPKCNYPFKNPKPKYCISCGLKLLNKFSIFHHNL